MEPQKEDSPPSTGFSQEELEHLKNQATTPEELREILCRDYRERVICVLYFWTKDIQMADYHRAIFCNFFSEAMGDFEREAPISNMYTDRHKEVAFPIEQLILGELPHISPHVRKEVLRYKEDVFSDLFKCLHPINEETLTPETLPDTEYRKIVMEEDRLLSREEALEIYKRKRQRAVSKTEEKEESPPPVEIQDLNTEPIRFFRSLFGAKEERIGLIRWFQRKIFKNPGIVNLHELVSWKDPYQARIALIHGADVNIRDSSGNTAIHRAAFWGNEEQIQMLVEFGADVEARNELGETPLHQAAFRGKLKAVWNLFFNGADINAKDNLGETPLHKSASNRLPENAKIIRFLTRKGANPLARTNAGLTPLDVAREIAYPSSEVIKALEKANTPLKFRIGL